MPKKKKTASARKSNKKNPSSDSLTKSALSLIDQAAALLKKGVLYGSEQTEAGRKAFQKRATTLANTAAKRINSAVNEGVRALNKKLK